MEDMRVDVAALDADATLARAAQVRRDRLRAECVELELAAHWADLHPAAAATPGATPAERAFGEQADRLGGAGTPKVLEFAAAELAAVWHLSITSAAFLIADALDLRHRLPRLWAAVCAGEVTGWKARRVALATRPLDQPAAAQVDQALHGWIERVSWSRFETLMQARIAEADPDLAEQRAADAAAARFVRSRRDEHGLMSIIARATAGDGLVFMALVDRIADILKSDGDHDPADVRRSKAIGILARPADAITLLYAHRDDPDQPPTPQHQPDDALPFDEGGHGTSDSDEPRDEAATREHEEAATDTAASGSGDQPHRQGEPRHAEAIEAHDADAIEPDEPHDPQQPLRPSPVDPRQVRPVAHLHLHLSAAAVAGGPGVARLDGYGALTVHQLLAQLAALGCTVRLQPVIDLNDTPPPVDRYEIPEALRRHLRLRQPGSSYPYSPSTHATDLDHTTPWRDPDRGGPPGQTRIGNLGPLSRREHRHKTFSRWRHRQPEPDTHLWRTPHGRLYLVNHDGTHDLGHGAFAAALWHAAALTADTSSTACAIDPSAA